MASEWSRNSVSMGRANPSTTQATALISLVMDALEFKVIQKGGTRPERRRHESSQRRPPVMHFSHLLPGRIFFLVSSVASHMASQHASQQDHKVGTWVGIRIPRQTNATIQGAKAVRVKRVRAAGPPVCAAAARPRRRTPGATHRRQAGAASHQGKAEGKAPRENASLPISITSGGPAVSAPWHQASIAGGGQLRQHQSCLPAEAEIDSGATGNGGWSGQRRLYMVPEPRWGDGGYGERAAPGPVGPTEWTAWGCVHACGVRCATNRR